MSDDHGTGIRDATLEDRTGRTWSQWYEALDRQDWPARLPEGRRDLRDHLIEQGIEPWWAERIVLGYERARGLRTVGETDQNGFQVGVRRTLDASPDALWAWLTSHEGMEHWLGPGPPDEVIEGEHYILDDGTLGAFTTVRGPEVLRLTWQEPGRAESTILQLRVVPAANGRSTLAFHHEKLSSEDVRDMMRAHWTRKAEEARSHFADR